MKVSELEGALLDYWVARAEGIPESELEIRLIPIPENRHLAPGGLICTRNYHESVDYSTDWSIGGPLLDKYTFSICAYENEFEAYCDNGEKWSDGAYAGKVLIAICRALVQMKFGDEVDSPQTYQQEK